MQCSELCPTSALPEPLFTHKDGSWGFEMTNVDSMMMYLNLVIYEFPPIATVPNQNQQLKMMMSDSMAPAPMWRPKDAPPRSPIKSLRSLRPMFTHEEQRYLPPPPTASCSCHAHHCHQSAAPVSHYHHQHYHHQEPRATTSLPYLPPLTPPGSGIRSIPKDCSERGCLSVAKVHGLCMDHFHHHDLNRRALVAPRPCCENDMCSSQRPLLPPIRSEYPLGHSHNHTHSPVYAEHRAYMYKTQPATVSYTQPSPIVALHHSYPRARAYSPSASSPTSPSVYGSSYEYATSNASDSSPSRTQATTSTRATCRRPNCQNAARRKGLCMEHGGRHFCKMAGCQKCAHRGGLCISHGGGRRCAVANCTKSAQSGGICYSHGGGKRCATEGCSHAARSGGFCIKHGKQQQQA